jgi:hypothetical protein
MTYKASDSFFVIHQVQDFLKWEKSKIIGHSLGKSCFITLFSLNCRFFGTIHNSKSIVKLNLECYKNKLFKNCYFLRSGLYPSAFALKIILRTSCLLESVKSRNKRIHRLYFYSCFNFKYKIGILFSN